jgi:hypothetical protein
MLTRFTLLQKVTLVVLAAVFISAILSITPTAQPLPVPTPASIPRFRGIDPQLPTIPTPAIFDIPEGFRGIEPIVMESSAENCNTSSENPEMYCIEDHIDTGVPLGSHMRSEEIVYTYNFDNTPTPSNITAEIIDHNEDDCLADGRPGIEYSVRDRFAYYYAGNSFVYSLSTNKALGGVSHNSTIEVCPYTWQLEVLLDLQSPVRLNALNLTKIRYWIADYPPTSHNARLKVILDADDVPENGTLFELTLCEVLFSANCPTTPSFDPVDGVRYVRFLYETDQEVTASHFYYISLDDFQFWVEPETTNNVIEVDNSTCTLVDAIHTANSGAAPAGSACTFSDFDDTVEGSLLKLVPNEVVLTQAAEADNGLPIITSDITIRSNDAQGRTIRRDANAPLFRILEVATSASLTLDNITVAGGSVSGDGGGIKNAGTLIIQNNSGVERNRASGDGGGIYNTHILSVRDSRIQRNIGIAGKGGGVFNGGNAEAVISNSCIVFNTAVVDGGIYAQQPANVNAVDNWWGHYLGSTNLGRSGTGFGDVVTSAINDSSPQPTSPGNVTGCIEYPGVIYSDPAKRLFNQYGDPGRAGEVFFRVEQILNRQLTQEEVYFAIIYLAIGTQNFAKISDPSYDDLLVNYFTEALGRTIYIVAPLSGATQCWMEVREMQMAENIFPSRPGFLCALGSTEWYGIDRRAEELAYEIVSWLQTQGNIDFDNFKMKAQLITSATLRNNTPNIACQNWEEGNASGYYNCPRTWGNVSMLNEPRQTRLYSSTNMKVSNELTASLYLSPANYLNDSNGADKGLEFHFAVFKIVPPDDFMVLTNNQDDVVKCPTVSEYRAASFDRRLWIIKTPTNARYPLCRRSAPNSDELRPGHVVENVVANNP